MKTTFTLLLSLISFVGFSQSADDILGVWFNEEKSAKIEIFKRSGEYFGKIIWLKEPNRDGKPKLDIHNPDEARQSDPVLGLEILRGFTFDDDEWEDGTIYDPKSGKTYSCVIEKENENLDVTGYIGFSWIGKTTTWTPVK